MAAVAPLFEQGRDRLWRILQIRGHDDGTISAGVLEPANRGNMRTEVARKSQRAHVAVGGDDRLGNRESIVVRCIVDDDPLPPHASLFEGGAKALMHDGKVARLVVGRRDYREEWRLVARHLAHLRNSSRS